MAIAASVTVASIAGRWAYEQFAPAPAGSRATVQLADGGVYPAREWHAAAGFRGCGTARRRNLAYSAGSHAVVKLADQSLVEVGERAEFRVSAARRDMTVHLNQGAVIIQAAKRRSGHLYVATGDSRVAVTGTVFSVNRGAKGTRVSVVEGEVVVERGHSEKILHAGDQLATHSLHGSSADQTGNCLEPERGRSPEDDAGHGGVQRVTPERSHARHTIQQPFP